MNCQLDDCGSNHKGFRWCSTNTRLKTDRTSLKFLNKIFFIIPFFFLFSFVGCALNWAQFAFLCKMHYWLLAFFMLYSNHKKKRRLNNENNRFCLWLCFCKMYEILSVFHASCRLVLVPYCLYRRIFEQKKGN